MQIFEVAGTLNNVYEFDEDGKRVFRCIRGHLHRGDYAMEDMLRCNCPHPAALFIQGEDSASCVECGQEIEIRVPGESRDRQAK